MRVSSKAHAFSLQRLQAQECPFPPLALRRLDSTAHAEHSTICIPHLLIDSYCIKQTRLLVIILSLVPNNVEELEAVLSLSSADDTKPIAQLLLLEELLRKVLQVTTRKLLVCHDLNTSIAKVVHGDVIAEVTGAAVDLDALLEESRECGWVEDAVLSWLGGVDDELLSSRVSKHV